MFVLCYTTSITHVRCGAPARHRTHRYCTVLYYTILYCTISLLSFRCRALARHSTHLHRWVTGSQRTRVYGAAQLRRTVLYARNSSAYKEALEYDTLGIRTTSVRCRAGAPHRTRDVILTYPYCRITHTDTSGVAQLRGTVHTYRFNEYRVSDTRTYPSR